MPDGLAVERLPIGLANGQWRIAFVLTGADFLAERLDFADRHVHWSPFRAFDERVRIEALGADLEQTQGGGGGGSDEYEYSFAYQDNGLTGFRISYLHEGETVASEVLEVTE